VARISISPDGISMRQLVVYSTLATGDVPIE
jgi:hypothetical protein